MNKQLKTDDLIVRWLDC